MCSFVTSVASREEAGESSTEAGRRQFHRGREEAVSRKQGGDSSTEAEKRQFHRSREETVPQKQLSLIHI